MSHKKELIALMEKLWEMSDNKTLNPSRRLLLEIAGNIVEDVATAEYENWKDVVEDAMNDAKSENNLIHYFITGRLYTEENI